MFVAGFPAQMFGTNCYVVAPAVGEQCVVVDPGVGVDAHLDDVLAEYRLQPGSLPHRRSLCLRRQHPRGPARRSPPESAFPPSAGRRGISTGNTR